MLCFKFLQNSAHISLGLKYLICFCLQILLFEFILNFYGETHFDCHEHYSPITLENCTMEKKEERGQLPWYTQYNDMRTAWNNSKVNNCLLNVLSFDRKICHAPCLASKYFILKKICFIQEYITMWFERVK